MSAFDTTMAKFGRPTLMTQLGQPSNATYSVSGQTDVSLTIVLLPEREEIIETERGGKDRIRRRDIIVTTDPDDADYGGVAFVSRRAKFTLADGEIWAVVNLDRTGSLTRCETKRVTPAEVTSPGFRDRR